jgi:hypothetical protein
MPAVSSPGMVDQVALNASPGGGEPVVEADRRGVEDGGAVTTSPA